MFTQNRLKDFMPAWHPFRATRQWAEEAKASARELFNVMCETDIKISRPGIASEEMRRVMLFQVFYSLCSKGDSADPRQAAVFLLCETVGG